MLGIRGAIAYNRQKFRAPIEKEKYDLLLIVPTAEQLPTALRVY
jgi:hypothetical protein